jgi:hypothetical protein
MLQRKPNCACGGGCPRCQEALGIQTKLKISEPGDRYEQEADRIADEVMRIPDDLPHQSPTRSGLDDNEVYPSPARSLATVQDSVVARQIDLNNFAGSVPIEEIPGTGEVTDEKAQPITAQLKSIGGVMPQAVVQPIAALDLSQAIDNTCHSSGRPLPLEARQFMESRFGHNFGTVRIHTDPSADHLAQQFIARAFTTGNHIFFASGEFQPDQTSGKYLLAHELAHVVQQSKGSPGMNKQIQRTSAGCLKCPPYCSYNKSAKLDNYNCAGLAHRTYDYKDITQTKAALAKGSNIVCNTPCDRVGMVKHWLWEFDSHIEDSSGKLFPWRGPNGMVTYWHDFHTVAGPTDGDPVAKDSDEFYSKDGARPVYGPGTGPSFQPLAKARATENNPRETPGVDDKGQPIYKVNSNITGSCYCFPCSKSSKFP